MIEFELHGRKGGGDEAHTPVETPNNLISVATAKVLIAVAEGELAGRPTAKDIFLDGTPLENADGSQNFGGVTWEWRSGSVDQEYIKGLPEVATEFTVGVELRDNTPWVREVTTPNLDAIRVTFNWPALLQQKSNGDTVGVSMDYAIDLSVDGGAFNEYQVYNVNGKTNAGYERTHRVTLPREYTSVSIRARRITPDNQNGNYQDNINVKSYAEVIDVKQRYPNTALLYVEFDSRMFGGTAIPKVSVRTKGRIIRVPSNYDPETRTYSGVWAGDFKQAWSDNPAWVYYDLVTQDRFGLGHKVSPNMVDKFALYEIAQHCDVMVDNGMGGLEPRATCNVYIAQKSGAWKVLRDIASIFEGMTYWDGNKFVVVADKQEPIDNIPMFSRSNVVNGRFDYQAADSKSIYTSALVSYDEPDDHFNTQVEAVFEREQILRWGSDRQTEISAIGCTSRGQAQRKGKYMMLTNMLNRTVSFQTGLQGMSDQVMPGKIIHVTDPLIGGRQFTGRIVSHTGRVVTLDRNIDGKAGDLLYLTRPNGLTEGRTIQSVSGNVVTVTVAYSVQITPGAVWYLEAKDLKSQLYRVTKVTSPSNGVYEIEGVEYNESKYSAIDNGARLEPRPISVVPSNAQQAPKNVRLSSLNFIEQTMAVTKLTISWDQTPNAVFYETQWKVDDGDWVNAGVSGANEIDISGVYTGNYVARVRAINALGIKSVWSYSEGTRIVGKEGKPPKLASITTTGMLFGIRLDWAFQEGSSDTLYTQFRYSETPSFEQSTPLGDFSYPTDSHEMHGLQAGKGFWFWARLQDRTGNYGDWFPAQSESGVYGASLDNTDGRYNDYFAGLISETALDKQLYDRIELIDGPPSLAGSVNQRLDEAVKAIEDQLKDITDALVYDPTKTYVKGDVVRQGQKLYQALGPVPLDTSPPNDTYWKDVGDILESADGLATRVELNEINIAELDGKVTAIASTYEAIQAQFREDDGEGELQDALNGYANRAAIIEERTVRADADEAMASRIITIEAETAENAANITSVETALATQTEALGQRIDRVQAETSTAIDDLEETVNVTISAQISNEVTARTNADEALGQRITSVEAAYKAADTALGARITTEETARANADTAMAKRVDTIEAGLITDTQVKALIQTETTARVNADNALGQRIDTVTATAGNNSVAIQQNVTATADVAGKVNGAYTLKMEAYAGNQYVAAGIALGVGQQNGLLQSQFLVRADRFAVVNGTTSTTTAPFVVSNGQVFIADALINKATITNAIIGSTINSSAQTNWGGAIMTQNFQSGSITTRHPTMANTYTVMSQSGIVVYVNGVLRVRMGTW